MDRIETRRLPPELLEFARRALAEDLGRGDITSELTVDAGTRAAGSFVAREDLVVSGLEAARAALLAAGGEEVSFAALVREGEAVRGERCSRRSRVRRGACSPPRGSR